MTLLDLERRLAGIGKRLPAEHAAALIADDFVEFGSSGRVWNKTDIVAAMAQWPPIDGTLEDFTVRELSATVCLVTYRLGPTLRSSIWRMDGDQWRIIFHHGSKAR